MNGAMTQTVRPAQDRDLVVDALRGLAVMGILAVNIQMFSWPFEVAIDPSSMEQKGVAYATADVWVYRVIQTVFAYKMQFLFGLLFGAGVVYYGRKFDGGPLSRGAGLWYRRMGVLLGLGLLHGVGLWYGDILGTYAAVGLVALWWVRRWPVGLLVGVGAALIGFGWMTGGAFLWLVQIQPSQFAVEMQAYGPESGYLDGLWSRLVSALFMYFFVLPVWMGPYFCGVMMLGMALLGSGVLRGERLGVSAALACAGLGVGVPGTLWLVAAMTDEQGHGPLVMSLHYVFAAPMALGYVGLVTWVFGGGRLGWLMKLLAPVGRMALTNYLLQTVICTTVFYGYGFGLYGQVGFVGLAGFVASVWVVNIVLSSVWLSHFRFGPMEWVWRTLTYGRVVGATPRA